MKKPPRRDRLKIYSDLLAALRVEEKAEKVVLTRVQSQINVPFDRFKTYLSELKRLGFIEDEGFLKITEKGRKFIVDYKKIREYMKQIGLES